MRLLIIAAVLAAMALPSASKETPLSQKAPANVVQESNWKIPLGDDSSSLNFGYESIRCDSVERIHCFELLDRSIERENEGWNKLFPDKWSGR